MKQFFSPNTWKFKGSGLITQENLWWTKTKRDYIPLNKATIFDLNTIVIRYTFSQIFSN